MTALRPVSVFGLKVPPNGLRIEANPGMPAAVSQKLIFFAADCELGILTV